MSETRQHAYESSSFRGSFPRFVCVYCGCDSTHAISRQPCPRQPLTGTREPEPTPPLDAWAFLASSCATLHCNYVGGDEAWSATVTHFDGGDDTVAHGPTPLAAVERLAALLHSPTGRDANG